MLLKSRSIQLSIPVFFGVFSVFNCAEDLLMLCNTIQLSKHLVPKVSQKWLDKRICSDN